MLARAALARSVASAASSAHRRTLKVDTRFKLHRIAPEDAPPLDVDIPPASLVAMYTAMSRMRRMEAAADLLYKQKLIRGFCHLNNGQEAIAVGIEHAITRDDAVITAYRCHGFTLMRGGTPTGILAELLGRRAGITKGKGGSMHMFAHNFFGGNGIVGAQVPLGAGIALAQQYRAEKAMTIALYGDGAANQGQVFEAYNMAALWRLPCVFACENNGYGMGTSAARASASPDFFSRGDYIPGVCVDGMDVLAVYAATKWAREYAIAKGPLVFEYATYRYAGHSMSDPGTSYRTREEVVEVRNSRDPIARFKSLLLSSSYATEDELKKIDRDIKTEIDAAVASATSSAEPDPAELYSEIYVKGTEPATVRGLEPEALHRFTSSSSR